MTTDHNARGQKALDATAAAIDDSHVHYAPKSLGFKEVMMDTFTLDPRCWCIGRIFGRNPLLRRTDRIEALVMLVALVVSLIAIPVAAAAGIAVYDMRDSRFTQEGRDRHTVVATVLETEPETERAGSTVVQARWPVTAAERTGPLQLTTQAKVGDRIEVWVDREGNPVAPPTPTWHAVGDAYGATMAILMFVGVTITSFVTGVRSRLDRERDGQWERELRCLEEGGGRTNWR
jgi:hypothetical protein